MCLTFAYYYPKLPVANCLSEPVLHMQPSQVSLIDDLI